MGLTLSPSEQLQIWTQFDRDGNGSVDYEEFRVLGAALLELAEAPVKAHKESKRGTFARRSHDQFARKEHAAARIQGLARQRSQGLEAPQLEDGEPQVLDQRARAPRPRVVRSGLDGVPGFGG